MTTVRLKATVGFVLVLYLQSSVITQRHSAGRFAIIRTLRTRTWLQLRYFEPDHKSKACFMNCVVDFLKLNIDSRSRAAGHFCSSRPYTIYMV